MTQGRSTSMRTVSGFEVTVARLSQSLTVFGIGFPESQRRTLDGSQLSTSNAKRTCDSPLASMRRASNCASVTKRSQLFGHRLAFNRAVNVKQNLAQCGALAGPCVIVCDVLLIDEPCVGYVVQRFGRAHRAIGIVIRCRDLRLTWSVIGAPIPRLALENPIGCISTCIRKPDQVLQPWWFGDDASKATCLWLKNLPCLTPTNRLPGDHRTRRANQTRSGQNKLGPSPDRARLRSLTYPGIAAAMAQQWGDVLLRAEAVA